MLRLFDLILAALGLSVGLPFFCVLTFFCLLDTGSPLFFQTRVGRQKKPFTLIKFRTMRLGTDSVATHLLDVSVVTFFGRFLRKTKLDEFPQLWNVLKGDMSLVGPRPCLFNQKELIVERVALGVFNARPGITGFAQIMGIDMSTPRLLAETDAKMLKAMNLATYFKCIFKTLLGSGRGDRIKI